MEHYAIKAIDTGAGHMVQRLMVPLEIGSDYRWGIIDTGAPFSLLPAEDALELGVIEDTNLDPKGKYTLLSGVRIPYLEKYLDMGVMGYEEKIYNTPWDIWQYENPEYNRAFDIGSLKFRIPLVKFEAISNSLRSEDPEIEINRKRSAPPILLGMNFIQNVRLLIEGGKRFELEELSEN